MDGRGAREVGAVRGVRGVGMGTGREVRSQCRMEPSEPPETRMGCTGCHVTADKRVCKVSQGRTEEASERLTYSTLLFCVL